MSQINSRLSLVTNSTSELVSVQEELLKVSNEARVGLQGTSDLYSQLARSTSQLGIESSALLGVTKTISQSITISGASATSASAALFQLSQGFSAGALRGEELNSVMEQTPRLAQAIADGMGVSIGELRKLGAEGALTSEKVLTALQSQASAVNSEFAGIAVNATQGYQVLQNEIDKTVGKLDQQHKVTETIGTAFTSLATTMDTLVSAAFKEIMGDSLDFGEVAVNVISSVIKGAGTLYDAFEILGDIFNLTWAVAKAAFFGIQVASSTLALGVYEAWDSLGNGIVSVMETVANGVQSIFQDAINGIISAINIAIKGINLMGGSISYIADVKFNKVSFTDEKANAESRAFIENFKQTRVNSTRDAFAQAQDEIKVAWDDMWNDSTTGRDTADKMIEQFQSSFKELSKNKTGGGGDVVNPLGATDNRTQFLENQAKQDEYTKTMLENMDTTREETEATEAKKETTEATNDFLDTFYNDKDSVYETMQDTTKKADNFSGSLSDLDSGLTKVIDTMDTFIFQFTDTFLNSIKNNISALSSISQSTSFSNVSYRQALENAQSIRQDLINNPLDVEIGNQFKEAYDQFITSSSEYLTPTNFQSSSELAFARASVGVQGGAFQDTATKSIDVLESMNTFLESINQAFSDGILTDSERADIKGVAGEVNAKNTTLMGGISSDLVGDNSVSAFIKALTSNIDSGVTISDLLNSTTIASVASGLKTDEISNLKNASDKTAAATEYMTSNNSTSLKNLQVKSVMTHKTNYTFDQRIDSQWVPTTVDTETTSYDYYDKGGFTGNGIGKKDSTGFKQAGIVHEGEYVAPKWMVDSNPMLFNQMEVARQKGSFADGGFTSQPSFNVSATMGNNSDLAEIRKDIKQLTMILNNVTEGGNLMNVALRA